jgi:cytochrome P450 family 6
MGFLLVILFFVLVIYFANNYYLNYWTRRKIHQNDPTFFIGNMLDVFRMKKTIPELLDNFYVKFKHHKVFGFYMSYKPALIINDPELIQDVLMKDFNYFHDRGMFTNEEFDPLSAHLFSLSGQKWKETRTKLSPAFTSGKLRGMFPTILDCGKVLERYLSDNVQSGQNVFECRDLMARYTTNVISSVAFGVENDCINDRENVFREVGSSILKPSLRMAVLGIMTFVASNLFKQLKIKGTRQHVEDFIFALVKETIDYREKNVNFERKDLMQLLIQLKNQGFVSIDKSDENEIMGEKNVVRKLTFNEIAAQAFIFFVAGFETSSSLMSYCLFELSKNPGVQEKVHAEIDKIMKDKSSNELTNDDLVEMKYLECCIDETLRKYPIAPFLFRSCTKDYTFSNTDLKVEKGTMVFIPILGLHRDPEIYENPLEFIPERFENSPHGNGNSTGIFYSPFGNGPRICIGARMGKLQSKLGLALILSKFKVELADENDSGEIKIDRSSHFLLMSDRDINLKITPR